MSWGRRLGGVALVGVVLAGAAVASSLLEGSARRRVAVEAERAAREAAVRAKDALAAQAESVSLMARNAAANPPLAAALRARVDRRTLGDLFASESWWAPYRFYESAVSYDREVISFAQPGTRGLPLGELVARVRSSGELVSAVLAGETRAHLVAAVAIPLSISQPPAVLILTRPLHREALRSLAERAGGAVLVLHGQRALGHYGEDAALEDTALQRPHPADPAWSSSSLRLAPELTLWVGTSVAELARAEARAAHTRRLLLGGGAGLLSLPILFIALRRRRPVYNRRDERRPGPAVFGQLQPRAGGHLDRPTALGRYLLVDRIGEGGMAEVFTAISFGAEGFRRSFVVKRLRPEMAVNPNAVAHFIEEANTMSRLVHPNIVPVFDFGEVGGAFFIAEEHIVGRDLARLCRQLVELGRPALSVNAVLYVIHEILTGLQYVHGANHGAGTPVGFVHRDVSPQNVMISRIGEVKLLDFGIMKANHSVSQTDIGTVKGNVDFMSPEQARGRAVDQRSDLFSVGLVLYHSLAREPLYHGESLYDRLSRAASGPGPAELARIAALPHPVPQLLGRALQIDPTRRFQTASEFRAAVAGHVAGGDGELAALVSELFDGELQAELDHLAAVTPPPRVVEQGDRQSG
jgi:hypothetical protein